MTAFNVGDTVSLDGTVVTITSWPAEDIGFFTWEKIDRKSNAVTRGTGWYGITEEGSIHKGSADIELISAGAPVVSTLGDLHAQLDDLDEEPTVGENALHQNGELVDPRELDGKPTEFGGVDGPRVGQTADNPTSNDAVNTTEGGKRSES